MSKFQVKIFQQGQRLAASLTPESGSAGLVRIPIAKLGNWVKGKQKFSITKETLSDLVANLRKRQADTVIDYDHASEFPERSLGQPIPAAGWVKSIEDAPDDDGVLYGSAEFTDRAQKMIKSGEYKYLSPVIDWSRRDKVTGEAQGATLTSVALTNRPFLEAMPALALTEFERQGEWEQVSPDGYRSSLLIESELDAAIAEGKLLPNQRAAFQRLAMFDLDSFRAVVSEMPYRIDLRDESEALVRVEKELSRRVAVKMKSDPEMQHHYALKLVARESPELDHMYTALRRRK